MKEIFTFVFNMSITASYVIAAVLAVSFFLRRLPKKYSYLLWSVVGFRLAMPISFDSVFSLFSLNAFDMSKAQAMNSGTLDYIPVNIDSSVSSENVTIGIPQANAAIGNAVDNISQGLEINIIDSFMNEFSYIWLAVMSSMIIYGLVSYVALKMKMSNAVLKCNNIYESDKVASPFILGFISPRIYIPFGLEDEVYTYVTAHEKCHIRRYDYYVKAFAFLLLSLHWFNPLCWLAFHLMTRDMEMSCDEKVLSDNDGISKAYSRALLSFAVKMNKLTPLCFSENGVKARIKNILKFKKPRLIISVIATVLCIAIIVACAANPKLDRETQSNDIEYGEKALDLSDISSMFVGVPKIIYADKEKLIIFGGCGLLLYDLESFEITQRIPYDDLKKLGVFSCYASNDGNTVYLCSEKSDDDMDSTSYSANSYYSVSSNKIINLSQSINVPFNIYYCDVAEKEFFDSFADKEMTHGKYVARAGNNAYFLQISDDNYMGSLQLVWVDEKSNKIVRCINIFDISYYSYDGKGKPYYEIVEMLYKKLTGLYDTENFDNVPHMITAYTGAEYLGDFGSGIYCYHFQYDDKLSFIIGTSDFTKYDPFYVNYYYEGREYAYSIMHGELVFTDNFDSLTIDDMKKIGVKISAEKAEKIALKEIRKDKYRKYFPDVEALTADDAPYLHYVPYSENKKNYGYYYSLLLVADNEWCCCMEVDAKNGSITSLDIINPYDDV